MTRAVTSGQPTRRTRQELRASLVEEGRDLLLAEGLAVGASNLTFKRVFGRLEARTGVRLTNASVIGRVWANQVDFQADVLVTVAREEARRAEGMGQRSVSLLGAHDMTTPESRARALREVCRAEGNASSAAIDRSANWSLWINVVSMSTSNLDPGAQARIKEALEMGYQAVTRFWSENFSVLPSSDCDCSRNGRSSSSPWRRSPSPKGAPSANWRETTSV